MRGKGRRQVRRDNVFGEMVSQGIAVAGWIIGFLTALAVFAAVVVLICLLFSFAFGGGDEDENEEEENHGYDTDN